MHLIQALLPSKLLSNEDAIREPDAHGGFEMGTWDYPNYLRPVCIAAGVNVETITPGFQFTPEQCARAAQVLRRKRPRTVRGKQSVYYGRDYIYKKPVRVHLKWHRRLIKLFESGAVTYFAR